LARFFRSWRGWHLSLRRRLLCAHLNPTVSLFIVQETRNKLFCIRLIFSSSNRMH
jgi:hypothetical protein